MKKFVLIGLIVLIVLISGCIQTDSTDSGDSDNFNLLVGDEWMIEELDLSDSGVNEEAYLFTSKTSCVESNFTLKCGKNGAPSCEEIIRQLEEKQATSVEINGMFCYGQKKSRRRYFCRV